MQLSALSFTPNLLQSKPVDTKVALVTTSQADSFTPLVKIRQGTSPEVKELSLARKIATGIRTLCEALVKSMSTAQEKLPLRVEEKLSEPIDTTEEARIQAFYRSVTEDEQY
jgi:hypothetical protein